MEPLLFPWKSTSLLVFYVPSKPFDCSFITINVLFKKPIVIVQKLKRLISCQTSLSPEVFSLINMQQGNSSVLHSSATTNNSLSHDLSRYASHCVTTQVKPVKDTRILCA